MGVRLTVVDVGQTRMPAALPASVQHVSLARPEGRGPRWFWDAHRRVKEALRSVIADLYLASDLYVLPACAAAASTREARLVYDSREIYTHLDSSAGRPWVRWLWGGVEHRYITRADAVLTVNEHIADFLSERYGIARPVVLYNAPEMTEAPPVSNRLRKDLGLDDRPIVLYQGLLREGRGLPALVQAMREVEDAHLVIVGEGALEAELRRSLKALGTRGHLLPFIPPDRLPAVTASADLGAMIYKDHTLSVRWSLPNKLFEYLAAGLPVLASPLPEIRRVIETHDVGLLADPDDPVAVAAALRRALTDSEARARWIGNASAALSAYSWSNGAVHFQTLISDLLPTHRTFE